MSVKKHENAGSGCSGACCLKVADLSVSLGEQTILEHVSFHLHCGEITALIGPNGAGKSTLFRTILGQLPYAGTIDFQQAGGRRTRPLIGYVPQSPSFDRGDPVSVLDLFVSAIDAYLKQNGKYAKNESKITFQDVADCLVLVTNCFSTQTSYENQTKKSINNRFIQEAMTEFFRSRLQVYFLENKQEADRIAEQVLINKRSRETAERARITVKKKLSGNLDIANRVQKFVDCRSRDASRRELYIVEGDSAMGSVKLSRDAEFQGIMPIRGKILNCLKADYARIFKSEIITDLLRVMGCGVEVRDKHVKDLTAFDLGSLRWNKIVICTDADYDGFQIRTLVLTMLYRLVPTLIREGYVYIAETPLFEITCKDKTWFAYNETEKADILKKLEGKKISVARSKGLGENEPEMMWLTTMNPETRRLIKVMPEDAEKTAFYFDLLLGDNLAGRKEYIAENGSQYLEMADIS